MSAQHEFSEAEINAFLDCRLEPRRRLHMQEAMVADREFAEQVRRMQAAHTLVEDVYRSVPVPDAPAWVLAGGSLRLRSLAAVLVLAMLGSGMLGWLVSQRTQPAPPPLQSLAQYAARPADSGKILLHISSADPERVTAALDAAERILRRSRDQNQRTRLEIVANAEGLAILREGSPYAQRIQSMLRQYRTISFKACGIAMETARLKEGVEVRLVPEAQRVDAALDRILNRIREGWTYIRA